MVQTPSEDTASRLSELRTQLTALRNRRRSSQGLREWKADIFYYLFALPVSAVPIVLIGVTGSRLIWSVALCAISLLFLCYLPPLANYLRYKLLITLPNRRLQRRIDMLTAEIDRKGPERSKRRPKS